MFYGLEGLGAALVSSGPNQNIEFWGNLRSEKHFPQHEFHAQKYFYQWHIGEINKCSIKMYLFKLFI